MKAIDTEHNGYRFRSRLEARWAVFFDAIGVRYSYECEGFTYSNERYLPDFYLPEFQCFIEIKPRTYEVDAPDLVRSLCVQSLMQSRGMVLFVVEGDPWPDEYSIHTPQDLTGCAFAIQPVTHALCYVARNGEGWGVIGQQHTSEAKPHRDNQRLLDAFKVARGARFEHDARPRVLADAMGEL